MSTLGWLRYRQVIATTGYGRAEDRARCLAAGFDHHLTKPIDVDAIEALVARIGE